MSGKLVEYALEDGSSIVFETQDDESGQSGSASKRLSSGGGSSLPQKAEKTLKEVSQRIGPAAETLLSSFKDINTPEEIKMEFGLKFSLNAGVIIASADSEVNFKVTVKWVNKDASKQD